MNNTNQIIENVTNELITKLQKNEFLERCRTGDVTLDELKFFLIQQGLYSRYFTRYLCAIMSNLSSNEEVLEIAENLFEELGLEPDSPIPHSVIYKEMLDYFELSLEDAQPTDGTQLLIDKMFQYCRNTNPIYGLSALCLGAEALVPSLYTDIIKGFESHGIESERIDFFHLHVECDDGHAETILQQLNEYVSQDETYLEEIIKTGHDLVDARCIFFDDISKETIRRKEVV